MNGASPELLATRHFVRHNVPLPLRLPAETLDPSRRYLLRVGNDVNAREDRVLLVEGSRAVLEHDFVAGDTAPLSARAGASDPAPPVPR